MSSFIQEIKIATTTSLDVIMKNGRAQDVSTMKTLRERMRQKNQKQ